MNKYYKYISFFILLLICSSCGVYSFTGVNLDPSIKTISVQTFFNETGQGPPNMAQQFTEDLRDYYLQNSSLTIVNSEGDLQIEGEITKFEILPVAPVGAQGDQNQPSAQSRLKIGVNVNFVNTYNEEEDFETVFSFFGDFEQSKSISDVEETLIPEITEQIILDIFTKTVANW